MKERLIKISAAIFRLLIQTKLTNKDIFRIKLAINELKDNIDKIIIEEEGETK